MACWDRSNSGQQDWKESQCVVVLVIFMVLKYYIVWIYYHLFMHPVNGHQVVSSLVKFCFFEGSYLTFVIINNAVINIPKQVRWHVRKCSHLEGSTKLFSHYGTN